MWLEVGGSSNIINIATIKANESLWKEDALNWRLVYLFILLYLMAATMVHFGSIS